MTSPMFWICLIVAAFLFMWRKPKPQPQDAPKTDALNTLRAEVRELKEDVALLQKQQSAHND